MNKKNKYISLFIVTGLAVGLVGCNKMQTNIAYYDEIGNGYNVDLFNKNEVLALGADPGCLYITDGGEYDGYFFMYPTSDFNYDCKGIVGYKSKDLVHWETVGAVFTPESSSYITGNVWAPEVVYDGEALQTEYGLSEDATKKGVYYLFFNSNDQYNAGETNAELVFDTHTDKNKYDEIMNTTYTEEQLHVKISEYYSFYQIDKLDNEDYYKEFSKIGVSKFYEKYIESSIDTSDVLYKVNHLEDILDWLVEYHELKDDPNGELNDLVKLYADLETTPTTILNDYGIGVAVSNSPAGPFKQFTREGDKVKDGERTITIKDTFLSSEDMTGFANGLSLLESYEKGFPMIDANPFVDKKTGDKYLYFVRRHSSDSSKETNFICGIKMGKSWTDDPDWSTLKRLTKCNVTTVNGNEVSDTEDSLNNNRINEGPNMYYDANSDEYILTYSVNKLSNRSYSVAQAISTDGPLGDFTKVKKEDGGYILFSDSRNCVSGAGHHSIVEYNDKLYIVYHVHQNSEIATGQRGIAFDELYLTKNNKGQTVLQANGPTCTIQPIIDNCAEYKNIAKEASLSNNDYDAETLSSLTDGQISVYSFIDFVKECSIKGKTTFKFTFNDYKTVKAIMVYNSKLSETAFDEIAEIKMEYVDGQGKEQTAYICNLKFDKTNIDEMGIINQCSSAICEFDEMRVKSISITFNTDKNVGISEIRILGK